MLNRCETINGDVLPYDAAFAIDTQAEISPDLIYIGTGHIVEVLGQHYYDGEHLIFYIHKNHKSMRRR